MTDRDPVGALRSLVGADRAFTARQTARPFTGHTDHVR
jgi:hypothetical protein